MFSTFANPARFRRLADAVLPWAVGLTAVLMAAGLYTGLIASPPDYQQSETVRIMYVHVPAAWMALFVYATMATAAFIALIWRHTVAELYVLAAAPIGMVFTALCLVTGMLWGEPMWGTWWVWDARLTSVLVLFFIYCGYLALVHAFDDRSRGLRSGAVLVLIGVVNLPIIKFSVDWWNTLHQPASVSRLDAPALHADMLTPLLLMAAAYMALFTVLAIWRLRGELAAQRLRVAGMGRAPATGRVEPAEARHA